MVKANAGRFQGLAGVLPFLIFIKARKGKCNERIFGRF